MTKKEKLKRFRSNIQKGNKEVCRAKRRYPTIDKAWQDAARIYIQSDLLLSPYRCAKKGKGHYHLTSAGFGDLSHVPPELRPLFETHTQEPQEGFWLKLRRFIGVHTPFPQDGDSGVK